MWLSRFFRVVPALIVASGCSPAAPRFDPAAEADLLLRRDAEWAAAAAAGKDVDKILSYWADDAVVIPEGQPVVEGKEALRGFVTASLAIPGFRIHWVSDKVSFSPDGRMAWMRGTNEMTVPGPTGSPMTLPGRSLTIWRREADGPWLCVVDVWNSPPAAVSTVTPATE